MAVQIYGAFPDDREIIYAFDGMCRIFLPLAVDPCPDLYELAEIDFRVEIGGEIPAVTSGVDVQDVVSILSK